MKDYHFLIDEDILKQLQALPGTVTEHIRQAILKYLREFVSESLSGKDGDKNV
jgi:hypothetical protein